MILVDILLGIFMGAILLVAIISLSLLITEVYMFLFAHKEWRHWMKFSKNVEKFEYVGRYAGDGKSYEFIWGNYKAIVWYRWNHYDGCASIHSKDGKDVICSMFWKSKSKKFADKLICKIPTELK